MSSRYDLQEQKWCVTHACTADTNRDYCFWDLWAGPRPGRGKCEFYLADIIVQVEGGRR